MSIVTRVDLWLTTHKPLICNARGCETEFSCEECLRCEEHCECVEMPDGS